VVGAILRHLSALLGEHLETVRDLSRYRRGFAGPRRSAPAEDRPDSG
jgi:hypothetical protein